MSDVMQYFKTVLLKALNIKIHVLPYHIGKIVFPIFNVFLNIRFTNNPAVEYFFTPFLRTGTRTLSYKWTRIF